ncbi:enamine deaminase RidA [Enterococcus sp. JM4C]|uniref:RidA family protein n=1 Tax=Candidatus Enterococcus huntleyi TaxID=1857217 RepID=UPI001379B075|nr:RidA family protein [Enterococcus sp. JM4C]KAF1299463.1 enamine deaminase RidA [Enterococcus sp. JM4C]
MVMYSPSVVAEGPLLLISGQTPEQETIIPNNIEAQLDIVLNKIEDIIVSNQAKTANIVKMNIFITDTAYLAAVRKKVSAFLADTKPAMTLVVVAGLINELYMAEIDATVQL